MANSKSEQHVIPLNDPNLNRERLKGEIRPWQGFNDRNSPYLSGECLPLYKKEITGLTENSWISPSLDVYSINNDRYLTKNGSAIGLQHNSVKVENLTGNWGSYVLGGNEACLADSVPSYGDNIQFARRTSNGGWEFMADVRNKIPAADYDWDKAVANFSMNFATSGFNGQRTIAYVWCKYPIVVLGSTVYVGDMLGGDISTYTAIAIRNDSVWFWPKDATVAAVLYLDNNTPTWTYYETGDAQVSVKISPTYNYTWHNVDPNNLYMDHNGYFILKVDGVWRLLNSGFNDYTIGSRYYPDSDFVLQPVGSNINIIGDANNKTKILYPYQTNRQFVYNRYGVFANTAKVYDVDLDYMQYSVIASTLPLTTTNCGNISGLPEGGQLYDNGNIRLLYESGVLTAVSVTDGNKDHRGTLITPWATVDDACFFDDSFAYKSTVDSNWYSVKIEDAVPDFTVLDDRYIIIHSSIFYNTYDIVEDVWMHFADDWNNRFCYNQNNPDDQNEHIQLVSSAVESEYQITGYPFPGYQAPPATKKRGSGSIYNQNYYTDKGVFAPAVDLNIFPSYLNEYQSNEITVVDDNFDTTQYYVRSYYVNVVKQPFEGLFYTYDSSNPLFNPPLFTTFQKDLYTLMFIASNMMTTALQSSGKEVFVYYLSSIENNFDHICCIQSTFYGVTSDAIHSVTYSDGVINDSGKIAAIKGLSFVAGTPLGIIFWNNKNRTAYIFTGDAILKPVDGWSSFSQIKQTKYRADTQETFWLTNEGLYVASQNYCYRIPGAEFTDIFFTDYGFALKEYIIESHTYKCTCYAYYKSTGHNTTVPLMLETYLYGAGDNIVSTTDCVYIRLFKGDKLGSDAATVTVTGYTLTDIATTVEATPKTFYIPISDFDTKDGTYYLRYQPQYQKGLGISIKVTSDVPLIYMGFGNKLETLQITK